MSIRVVIDEVIRLYREKNPRINIPENLLQIRKGQPRYVGFFAPIEYNVKTLTPEDVDFLIRAAGSQFNYNCENTILDQTQQNLNSTVPDVYTCLRYLSLGFSTYLDLDYYQDLNSCKIKSIVVTNEVDKRTLPLFREKNLRDKGVISEQLLQKIVIHSSYAEIASLLVNVQNKLKSKGITLENEFIDQQFILYEQAQIQFNRGEFNNKFHALIKEQLTIISQVSTPLADTELKDFEQNNKKIWQLMRKESAVYPTSTVFLLSLSLLFTFACLAVTVSLLPFVLPAIIPSITLLGSLYYLYNSYQVYSTLKTRAEPLINSMQTIFHQVGEKIKPGEIGLFVNDTLVWGSQVFS